MEAGFYQSGDLTFRLAKGEDLVRISEIFNQNIALQDATLWQRDFTPEDLADEIRKYDAREAMYTLEYEGKVVGFGTIKKYHPKLGYTYTCDTSVFLDRSYVGRGLGTKFKKFILAECRRLQYHHVVAKILATNRVSIEYNLKLGYSMVGVQKEVGRIDGRWVDVVILQYLFENE